MSRFTILSIVFCLFTAPLLAQEITLPEKMEARTGRLAGVLVKSTIKMSWLVIPAADIDVFREHDPDQGIVRLRFIAYKDGQYVLVCAGTQGDKVHQAACIITVSAGASINVTSGGKGPTALVSAVVKNADAGLPAFISAELARMPEPARKLAGIIADNYESAAVRIAITSSITVAQINTELDAKNEASVGTGASKLAWAVFFSAWRARTDELKLSTVEQYAAVYRETAIGLRK